MHLTACRCSNPQFLTNLTIPVSYLGDQAENYLGDQTSHASCTVSASPSRRRCESSLLALVLRTCMGFMRSTDTARETKLRRMSVRRIQEVDAQDARAQSGQRWCEEQLEGKLDAGMHGGGFLNPHKAMILLQLAVKIMRNRSNGRDCDRVQVRVSTEISLAPVWICDKSLMALWIHTPHSFPCPRTTIQLHIH